MKRYNTAYVIREMQMKMRYHYTLIRMAKTEAVTPPNAVRIWSKRNFPSTGGGSEKWFTHFGRQFGDFLQN